MRLAQRLASWDGKDVAFLAEVYELHGHRDDFAAQVLEALEGVALAQSGGTWVLKRHLEQGGRIEGREAERFFAGLGALQPWEAQLNALQCLPFVVIPAGAREAVERFVRAALESEVKFVRAFAFTGLHELARRFEELRPEAESLMDAAYEEGPASVRARIRNLQRRGYGTSPGPAG